MKKIHPVALMRAKSRVSTSRAAWSAIAASTGLKPSQVKSAHTKSAWRWELKNKKAVKRTKTGARKKPSKARSAAPKKKAAPKRKKTTTKKKAPAKRKPAAKKMTASEAIGLSLILGLADNQVCSSGKQCHHSPFYRSLSKTQQSEYDAGRALLRRRTK